MPSTSRVILVAGGSNGIGRGIVGRFVRDGNTVVAWGRNAKRLLDSENNGQGRVKTDQVDVTHPGEVKQAVGRVVKQFGRIDVLVNAAGNLKPVTTTMPYEEAVQAWEEMIAGNLTSCFLLSEAVVPHIKKPGGRIIYIGSVSAHTGSGRPGGMGYAAAKAGISGLVFAQAKELGPQNITVNAVVPGLVADTGITSHYPPEAVKGYIGQTPLGRSGTPADIAGTVAFLASSDADFITGQFIHVNGGLLLGRS